MLLGCGMSNISELKRTWKTQINWLKEEGKHHGTLPKKKI
jgi:hypothetical protein